MVGIKEDPDEIIKIEFRFRKEEVFEILKRKGYKIESRVIAVPPIDEFLITEQGFTYTTFTAMKVDGEFGVKDFYKNVLAEEIKKFLTI